MPSSSSRPEAIAPADSAAAQADGAAEQRFGKGANRIESHSLTRSKSASARYQLIAEEAYRRAERRGFVAGGDWQDWFDAEREIDALLDPDL